MFVVPRLRRMQEDLVLAAEADYNYSRKTKAASEKEGKHGSKGAGKRGQLCVHSCFYSGIQGEDRW